MSESDIDKGARWSDEIASQLESTSVGILCLTHENLSAPWLLFEAGALSKIRSRASVCTLLLDVAKSDVPFPLALFQATQVDRADVHRLLQTVNRALGDEGLSAEAVERVFAKWWPDLEAELGNIAKLPTEGAKPVRPQGEVLEELVAVVRGLDRRLSDEVRQIRHQLRGYPRSSYLRNLVRTPGESRPSDKDAEAFIEELSRLLGPPQPSQGPSEPPNEAD